MATAALFLVASATLAVRDDEAPHDTTGNPVALRADDVGSQGGSGTSAPDASSVDPAAAPTLPGPVATKAAAPGGRPKINGGAAMSPSTTTTGRSGPTASSTSTTTTAFAPSGEPPGGDCSSPKTCDRYVLKDGPNGKGWRPGPDGVARIRFHVNVKPPPDCGVTEDTVEAAYLRMTQVVESTHPGIRFQYLGRTDRTPTRGDGYTDFAFGSRPDNVRDSEGYWVETDILLSPASDVPCAAGQLGWELCEQRDGSCAKAQSGRGQIEHTIMHELIHTLGLGDLTGEETYGVSTMHTAGGASGSRFRVTLDLGTVKGLRKLYPTSAPWPRIYEP